jgi:broad specificity phosphatase PhoE
MDAADSIYRLVLLRHGESDGNSLGQRQGQLDLPLTKRGQRQVEALALRWQAESRVFDRVFSSPLSRARQTALILSRALDAPLEFSAHWMERDLGKLSGLPVESEAERAARPFTNPFQPVGETGETQWELYLRAAAALQKLLHCPPGRYLVVSHGGLLNMLLYAVLGLTPQPPGRGPAFHFGNASFASLSYRPQRNAWAVEGLNDQLHLLAGDLL